MPSRRVGVVLLLLGLRSLQNAGSTSAQEATLGLFEEHADLGTVQKAGSVEYDPGQRTYVVAGGGENMWATTDAFHYVWKRMSGDLSLAADIRWVGTEGNAHRKAGLVIRQSLDPDSPYADVVVHGNGLTSIQYREVRGGPTREIQSNVSAPRRIRIDKQGDSVSMSVAREGETLDSAGASFKIHFGGQGTINVPSWSPDSAHVAFVSYRLTNP